MIAAPSPSRPKFQLDYKGVDISSEVAPHLVSCTYTDKVHGEADEIEVTVQDKDGLWRGPWRPEHGDVVTLAIGYEPGPLVPCGRFEIDEPGAHLGRDGDTFTFRGLSAPVSKALRTRKTKAFEKQTLKGVAEQVAKEHGLTVVGTPPDVAFERVTQRRERDLEFLSRMADQFGAYFSVRGDKLVFVKREEMHGRDAVFTFRAGTDDYITADLKRAAHKTYSKAKVAYYDGNQKKAITAEVEDAKVKTGDTLKIDERVENQSQARARAKSELEKANLKTQTATLVIPGNPLVVAGQIVALDAGFGKWAGRYVVKTSRHHMTRSAYTTNVELNGV